MPGITPNQTSCAADKAITNMLAVDPSKVTSSTDDKTVNAVLFGALDACYPVSLLVNSTMKQSAPTITDAQLSCVDGKLTLKTWATVSAAGQTAFENDLKAAAQACGIG
jgi:hypothetical protein